MSNTSGSYDASVLRILKDIQSKNISPRSLDKDTRSRIVEHLRAEGYSVSECAEILAVNEKTIRRDMQLINQANALHFDPSFTSQAAGMIHQRAESYIGKIMRQLRKPGVSNQDFILGIRFCWDIDKDRVKLLQSLGILHSYESKVQADIIHHFEGAKYTDIDSFQTQLKMIEAHVKEHEPENSSLLSEIHTLNAASKLLQPPIPEKARRRKKPDNGKDI